MQGECARNLFDHPPNAKTQKMHKNLRKQCCPSHVETHVHQWRAHL
jgi:hypothetical protein